MRVNLSCLAAAALLPMAGAQAQVNGVYLSLGAGMNKMDPAMETSAYSGRLNPYPGFDINVGAPGQATAGRVGPTHYDVGWLITGAVGYGFGNNLRVELQGSYTSNGVNRLNGGLDSRGFGNDPLGLAYRGAEQKTMGFVNAFYDFNQVKAWLGVPLVPYLGVGVGAAYVDWHGVTRYSYGGEDFTGAGLGIASKVTNAFKTADWALAVQGIAGVSYDIPGVPGLALTADFRFVDLPNGFTQKSTLTLNFRSSPTPRFPTLVGTGAHSTWGEERNYGVTVGLRYAFNAPAAAPAAAVVAPVAPPAAARTYLVFFDWDRADLTDRARQIIAEAAGNAKRTSTTRIEVAGHADRSGTPAYNQKLSQRRADNVAAELVRQGIAKSEIAITAFGESRPLVPTADGVREPQNRRVEIVLK